MPHFAFPPSAIIKRKPLSATARRAGWVGCNFALNRTPVEARIWLVTTIVQSRAGVSPAQRARQREQSVGFADAGRRDACPTLIATPSEMREKFQRVKPLKHISVKQRGWRLDVLNIVRRVVGTPRCGVRTSQRDVPTNEFTNEDVYAFARELEQLHRDNRSLRTATGDNPVKKDGAGIRRQW
jgi:type II restriction enzyme